MPQHTLSCAIHLPVALVEYRILFYYIFELNRVLLLEIDICSIYKKLELHQLEYGFIVRHSLEKPEIFEVLDNGLFPYISSTLKSGVSGFQILTNGAFYATCNESQA